MADRAARLDQLLSDAAALPFRFTYDGRPSAELLPGWQRAEANEAERERSVRRVSFTAPDGLVLELTVTALAGPEAVEWVGRFTHTGATDSGIISDVQALAMTVDAPADAAVALHWAKGSECKPDDFAPHTQPLAAGGEFGLESIGGRSSCGVLPFFNLQAGDGGTMVALGWTGDWRARWQRTEAGVAMTAGLKATHFRLHPGESVRSPRMLVVRYRGDRWDGQNRLRATILDNYLRRRDGLLLEAPLCYANWGECRADDQLAKLRWFQEAGVPLDVYWIDAGWHGDEPYRPGATVFNTNWGAHVGNWYPNPNTYPDGLRPIGEAAAEADCRLLVWFEIERVWHTTRWVTEHPEYLLGPVGDNYLFDLGNAEACDFLIDFVATFLAEQKITLYRQDFNMDPAPFWQAADAPDRVGIAEMKHIEGLYRFWDGLVARHPDLIIDNCSSGGRRIDLETIARSIPFWRSDVQCWRDFDPIQLQNQTVGLCPWVPMSAGAFEKDTDYSFRSALSPAMVLATNLWETAPPPLPADFLRRAFGHHRELRALMDGEFYPLTEYSLRADVWAVYQWHRPDLNQGCVVFVRRPESPYPECEVTLRGAGAGAWRVHCLDTGTTMMAPTGALVGAVLRVRIEERGGTAIWRYQGEPPRP